MQIFVIFNLKSNSFAAIGDESQQKFESINVFGGGDITDDVILLAQ